MKPFIGGTMKLRMKIRVVVMLMAFVVAPLFAHHSFAAEYDSTKPVTLSGVVTKVDWLNPHARFHIDVKGPDGAVANWDLELVSPNFLMRRGWNKDSLKVGDTVKVSGFLAKDGSKLANARTVQFPDGRNIFLGEAESDGAAPSK